MEDSVGEAEEVRGSSGRLVARGWGSTTGIWEGRRQYSTEDHKYKASVFSPSNMRSLSWYEKERRHLDFDETARRQ